VSNPAKAKGTALETAIVGFAKENGFPDAHRNALAGSKDIGDVNLRGHYPVAIEAKNRRSMDVSGALREAIAEAANIHPAALGVAVLKKRGTTDVGKYYAILQVEDLMWLLKAAGY
jgi:Holliday junction resolvase